MKMFGNNHLLSEDLSHTGGRKLSWKSVGLAGGAKK